MGKLALRVHGGVTSCLNLGRECSWIHASVGAVWVGVERELLFSSAWEKSLLSSHILKEVTAITVEKGSPGLEQLEAIPENRLDIVLWVLINTTLCLWKGYRPP